MSYLATRPDSQVYFQPAIDYFSGNGATSQFTLSRPVASVAQIIVSVANVIQNPNTFSVNNNILTLGGNAPVGTNNIWVQYQTAVIQVNQPGQGTVGTNQLMDAAVTAAKLTEGAAVNNIGFIPLDKTVLAGSILFFARTTAPTGFIKANGAVISRSVYADLFAAIGTTFGAGDGTTTFSVPDLRGEFLRVWDDARGIDSGRTLGSYQKGSVNAWNVPASEGYYGAMAAGPDNNVATSRVILGYDSTNSDSYAGSAAGHSGAAVGNGGTWYNDDGWGGGVTRPRNIALLACIKY